MKFIKLFRRFGIVTKTMIKLSNFLCLLLGVNIGVFAIIKWDHILHYFQIREEKLVSILQICLSLELLSGILIALLLIQNSSKIMKKFFEIKLTYRIVIGFIMGILVGLFMRFNPDYFAIIGIHPSSFKLLGKIFIDLIKMIIAPLIFASITCSIISGEKDAKTGSMALKAILTFITMTLISVCIGIAVTTAVKPGNMIKSDPYKIIETNKADVKNITTHATQINTFGEFVVDIIPENIFKAFNNGNFLQIIFFATIFGVAIKASKQLDGSIAKGMKSLNDIMFKITDLIMHIAPFGIFGFTSWIVGSQDISLIKSLGIVTLIVYGSITFMVYALYSLFILFVLKLNPLKFYKKIAPIQFTGYLLASSSAMLPTSLKTSQERLGVSKEKALFIIPLGATINMNGSALNLGVSVIFISQIFGVNFTGMEYLYIITLCTLGAVGTAPIPGASIFLLSGILSALHLPVEAIGLILAIDRILDMARTFGNLTGDILSAVIVDKFSGSLNKEIWDSK